MKKIFTFLIIGLPILIASATNEAEELSQQPITQKYILEQIHQQIKQASDTGATPDIDLVTQALNHTVATHPVHETTAAVLKSVISNPIMPDTCKEKLEWFELALSQHRLDQRIRQIAVNALDNRLQETKNAPDINILKLALKYSKDGDQLFNTILSSLNATVDAKSNIELLSLAFEYCHLGDELKTFAINKLTEILNTPITSEETPDSSWVKLAFKSIHICIGLWQIAVNHVTRVFQMAAANKTPLSPEWYSIGLRYLPRR